MSATPAAPPTGQASIEELFRGLTESWTRSDANAYGALFSEDADYVAFDGSHQRGRPAITQAHRALFEGPLRGSRLEGTLTDLRFLTPDVAVLHALGNTALAWQRRFNPRRRSIQTYVAQRVSGEWRFVAFHNTRVRPITPLQRRVFALLLRLRPQR